MKSKTTILFFVDGGMDFTEGPRASRRLIWLTEGPWLASPHLTWLQMYWSKPSMYWSKPSKPDLAYQYFIVRDDFFNGFSRINCAYKEQK